MEITTVKLQGNGYLLNGNMSVPKADGNSEYEAIKLWIEEGNTPEPKFTDEEIAQQTQDAINQEALQYLASTDWYVIRQQETGVAIPQDILDAREAARQGVVNG